MHTHAKKYLNNILCDVYAEQNMYLPESSSAEAGVELFS